MTVCWWEHANFASATVQFLQNLPAVLWAPSAELVSVDLVAQKLQLWFCYTGALHVPAALKWSWTRSEMGYWWALRMVAELKGSCVGKYCRITAACTMLDGQISLSWKSKQFACCTYFVLKVQLTVCTLKSCNVSPLTYEQMLGNDLIFFFSGQHILK